MASQLKTELSVTLNIEQAKSARNALAFYAGILMGNINVLVSYFKRGHISAPHSEGEEPSKDFISGLQALTSVASSVTGGDQLKNLQTNEVHIYGRRAHELMSQLDKGIAAVREQDNSLLHKKSYLRGTKPTNEQPPEIQVNDDSIKLSMSIDQAASMREALSLYARVCIGQIEDIGELARDGYLVRAGEYPDEERSFRHRDHDFIKEFEDICYSIKYFLGHPKNGSHGIHNEKVHDSPKRAWEIRKVMDQAVARSVNPNPPLSERTVDYDGLRFRDFNDSPPSAKVHKTNNGLDYSSDSLSP